LKCAAFFPGFIVGAPHLIHRREHKPRLDIARIDVQYRRQICQREIELMHPLMQRGAQDQYFLGCSLEAPPWGKRSLGISSVTWVTCDAAQFRVALRNHDRQGQIVRHAGQLTVQCA